MSRPRLAALAATLSCVLLLGAVGSASAQTTPSQPFTKVVPITGTAANGKKFTGTFTIQRFAKESGKLVAKGRISGFFKGRHISRAATLPVKRPTEHTGAQSAQITPTPGSCRVLDLTLGPIDLNLLGLRVRTNQINLLIEAVPGAGNLLGNLLCAVTHLLDQNALANTPLGQLVSILNSLLALVPRTV